jgi:hypothetical protein
MVIRPAAALAPRPAPPVVSKEPVKGAGSADQVEGRGRDDQPGGVRVEMTRWQVHEGAVVQVGEDLPGDGVAAVEAAERAL